MYCLVVVVVVMIVLVAIKLDYSTNQSPRKMYKIFMDMYSVRTLVSKDFKRLNEIDHQTELDVELFSMHAGEMLSCRSSKLVKCEIHVFHEIDFHCKQVCRRWRRARAGKHYARSAGTRHPGSITGCRAATDVGASSSGRSAGTRGN